MKILFVTSEVAPFAKAGGLGDVCAALPRHLAALGHDVRIVMPFYARVRDGGWPFEPAFRDISVALGRRQATVSILESHLPGTGIPVYGIRSEFFDRPSIYTMDDDEHLRFVVLQWAALSACQYLQWSPDTIHCNDWPSALVPLMIKTALSWDRLFANTKTVLTIHNVGHQGAFSAEVLAETGLSSFAERFHQDQLRGGVLNFLLTGILHANVVTTVSPTYAGEIQTPDHGVGLDPFLRARSESVIGILNGIDEGEWSPESDAHIPHRYSRDSLDDKEKNKAALLAALDLPYDPSTPVIGIVSRLTWQKGLDLAFDVLPALLRSGRAQVVVLGRGEPRYEQYFHQLGSGWPRGAAYRRAFSEPLAHLIEAGADMFLMPSRHEPCGLNQMYSLRYGTVPVVHRVGGLSDTVRLWRGSGSDGNGFIFDDFDANALRWALSYALDTWGSGTGADRERWRELQTNGMRDENSWTQRVSEYVRLYQRLRGEA